MASRRWGISRAMPTDKAKLVRELCALWSRGDLEAAIELIHPEARWEQSGKFIGSGTTYRVHDGVEKFWALFREPWEAISLEPVDFTEVDEQRVVSRTHFRGSGRTSGAVTETELHVVWTVNDGKVSGYQSFAERDDAIAAAGLAA